MTEHTVLEPRKSQPLLQVGEGDEQLIEKASFRVRKIFESGKG